MHGEHHHHSDQPFEGGRPSRTNRRSGRRAQRATGGGRRHGNEADMDGPRHPSRGGGDTPPEPQLAEIRRTAFHAARRAGASVDDAEDAAQEVTTRLCLCWSQPHIADARRRSPDYWRGYVAKSARNAYLDQLRSTDRRRARESQVGSDDVRPPTEPRPGVQKAPPPDCPELTSFHARLNLLDLAQTHLVGRQREIILLTYDEGLSTTEIATRLGLGERTVRDHRHKGLARLRTAMEP